MLVCLHCARAGCICEGTDAPPTEPVYVSPNALAEAKAAAGRMWGPGGFVKRRSVLPRTRILGISVRDYKHLTWDCIPKTCPHCRAIDVRRAAGP